MNTRTLPLSSSAFDEAAALRALAALSQASRLRIFRNLVVAGDAGIAAGALATQLEIAPSALSFHLKELHHAGLIEAKQEGRFVIYKACYTQMNALLAYLSENCCQGQACCNT